MVLRRVVPSVRYLSPSFFISYDEYTCSVFIQKSSHTQHHPPLFFITFSHTRAHTVAITRALRRISTPPRWVSHARVTTRRLPPRSPRSNPRAIASRARHTRPRRAKRSFIMLARTSVPTRTVATFERYAREDNECAVIADAPRGERGETRDARRRRMRANGGMADR